MISSCEGHLGVLRASISDGVPTVAGFFGGGDAAAAMGFVKQGLVVGGFLVVVGCLCEGDWEGPRCFLFPQSAGRGERCGFRCVQSPSGLVVFLSERSLFFLPGEAFFTLTGKLLSASGEKIDAPAL